jgi:hypothetical protein
MKNRRRNIIKGMFFEVGKLKYKSIIKIRLEKAKERKDA